MTKGVFAELIVLIAILAFGIAACTWMRPIVLSFFIVIPLGYTALREWALAHWDEPLFKGTKDQDDR